MSKIKTTEEWIDVSPEMAGKILDRHYARIAEGKFINRPVATSRIARYAGDMENDNWLRGPVPIIFDENDDLVDGQHRLEAIRKSGRTINFLVSRGWEASNSKAPGLIDLMDTGKPRAAHEMLHVHGWTSARNYSSCVNFVCRVAWGGNSPNVTYSSLLTMLNEHGIKDAIDRIMSRSTDHRDFQGRIVGPLAYYFTARPKRAMDFAASLFSFETTKGSPVATFLRWFKNRSETSTETYMKGICCAIRAFDSGEEIEFLKPHNEGIEWLANLNPQLRAKIRSTIPRNNASRKIKPPGEIKDKAKK